MPFFFRNKAHYSLECLPRSLVHHYQTCQEPFHVVDPPSTKSPAIARLHISSHCIIISHRQVVMVRQEKSFPLSEERPNPLPPLPRIPRLKHVPLPHTPRLHTNHLLPAILGSKIRHALRLRIPRVPNHNVAEQVASDFIARLVLFCDDDGLGGIGGVGTVDFGGDCDDIVSCFDGFAAGGFVFVRGGFEAGDGDGGDIL